MVLGVLFVSLGVLLLGVGREESPSQGSHGFAGPTDLSFLTASRAQ
jgi:hypothetical protein